MTNYSRSVLKSNGLHRPKIRLKKFGFSLKIVPANISKKLPAQVLSQIVFHPVFQLLSQMSHVCFHGRKRVHARLCQQDRTQRPTRRNRGRFRWGVSLPSERSTRFGNPAWPGVRTAYFAAFGPWSGVLSKNTESLRNSDALMRVAVPKASRPRCVIPVRILIAPLVGSVANFPALWYDKFNKLESVMH